MVLSILLLEKLTSLLIFMLVGGLLVRIKLLKKDAYKVISTLTLYFVNPCQILSTFRIKDSSYLITGLAFAFVGTALLFITAILFEAIIRKRFELNCIESVSIIHPNAGNIIVVLVNSVLGKEYGVYCIANIVISTVMMWTHARGKLDQNNKASFKRIFLNPNMIAVLLSGLMAIAGLSFPEILNDTIESAGNMSGCMSMLVTGMILGGMSLKEVLSYKKMWIVLLSRLVLIPFIFLFVIKICGLTELYDNGKMIMLIPFMAACSCCAATIVQMCAEYGLDGKYASSLNVVSTLLCIVTMPIMIFVYEIVI